MKYIVKTAVVHIPKGCTIEVKARTVTVKGKKGTLTKSFKHVKVDMELTQNKETKEQELHLHIYMNTYRQSSILHTIATHIRNMVNGVTNGFRYKMHEVHKHFPIDLQVVNGNLQIIKFLGGRDVKMIPLGEGVTCKKNPKDAGELWFEGSDVDQIGLTCSRIYQSCAAKNKDRRKFLDGIFTSEKQVIEADA